MSAKEAVALDEENLVQAFSGQSSIHSVIENFEIRESQEEMMKEVLRAYNENHICLIEAGTGTGKSFAYLFPALLWALKNKQSSIVSTKTINLQEQLLQKDIPLLRKILGQDFKACLLKGMGNYLCLRKFHDLEENFSSLDDLETKEMHDLAGKLRYQKIATLSNLGLKPTSTLWEKVSAEADSCTAKQCPFYDECSFFKARKEAASAQIIIVNHHLLFSDLAAREKDSTRQGILPSYDRLILDEAHHVEDVASKQMALRVSHKEINQLLLKISFEQKGRLFQLREKVDRHFKSLPSSFISFFDIDLMATRLEILNHSQDFFLLLSDLYPRKTRILEEHFKEKKWQERVQVLAQKLIDSLQTYQLRLLDLERKIKDLGDDSFFEKNKNIFIDIEALATQLERLGSTLKECIFDVDFETSVLWLEEDKKGLSLVKATLDLSKILSKKLFFKFSSVVLCSATLATDQNFHFFRKRLGLTEKLLPGKAVYEKIYHSPFDYQRQALIAVPKDMPSPLEKSFPRTAAEKIWEIIVLSRGGCFVLFTSFELMLQCRELLNEKLHKGGFILFQQGQQQRQALVRGFQQTKRAVLFATDSFWEGVDVVGDALRCVIIVKLPFQVPSEPMIEARMEAIEKAGGNAFMHYSVPKAIVKFKQGFGRLIRNKKDRGCIICLDPRLMTKPYGQKFLKSLPQLPQIFESKEKFESTIKDFYRKTYFSKTQV